MPGWHRGSLLSLLSATVLSSEPTVGTSNCHACSSIINLHVSRIPEFLGGAEVNLTHFYSPSMPVKELWLFFLFISSFSIFMCMSVQMCVGTGVGVHVYMEV